MYSHLFSEGNRGLVWLGGLAIGATLDSLMEDGTGASNVSHLTAF